MRILFAVTYYLLARLNQHDQHHERVIEFSKTLKADLVTTDWVLMELVDGLASSEIRDQLRGYVEILRNSPTVEVIDASPESFERALNFFHRHSDKAWSLTDCTSFIVMRDRGITEALTGDKHFEQAGFIPLFK